VEAAERGPITFRAQSRGDQENLSPPKYDMNAGLPERPVAVAGVTRFVQAHGEEMR
jgi:hypothetical protein